MKHGDLCRCRNSSGKLDGVVICIDRASRVFIEPQCLLTLLADKILVHVGLTSPKTSPTAVRWHENPNSPPHPPLFFLSSPRRELPSSFPETAVYAVHHPPKSPARPSLELQLSALVSSSQKGQYYVSR